MRFIPSIASALGLAACSAVSSGCAGTMYSGAGFVEAPYYEDGHHGPGPFHDTSYYEDLYGSHGAYDGFIAPDRRDATDGRDQVPPGPVHHGRRD